MLHRRETGHRDAPITKFMRNLSHQWRGFYPGTLIATDHPTWATDADPDTA